MEFVQPAQAALSPEHEAELLEAKRLLEHPGYVAARDRPDRHAARERVKTLPRPGAKGISSATTASLTKCLELAPAPPCVLPPNIISARAQCRRGADRRRRRPLSAWPGWRSSCRGVDHIMRARSPTSAAARRESRRRRGPPGLPDGVLAGRQVGRRRCRRIGLLRIRIALAKAMSEASLYLARHGAAREAAPALARPDRPIGARFKRAGVAKGAAMMVPIVGAAGGRCSIPCSSTISGHGARHSR